MSEQQALILPLPKPRHYGSWVRHPQIEVASGRLALWLVRGGLLWLSSLDVAGKSHFVQALSEEHEQVVLLDVVSMGSSVRQLESWLKACTPYTYWVLDLPAGPLPTELGYAVFHLIERAKQMNRSLLVCWRCEKLDLHPLELSSRLLMMERVDMSEPADDVNLRSVLGSVLQTMQWDMKETVLPTLLQHVPRKLSSLLSAIALLDAYSRKNRVKINAALALRVLK